VKRPAALLGLLLAAAGLGAPATAKSPFVSACEGFYAPTLLPAGQIVTRRGPLRLGTGEETIALVPVAGDPVIGTLVPIKSENAKATVFSAFGDVFYIVMPSGSAAVLVHEDGGVHTFLAGRLLSDYDPPDDALIVTKCVRVDELDVMVTPSKARRMGYTVVSGVVARDPKAGAEDVAPPVADDAPLSSLFDSDRPSDPEDDGSDSLAAAMAESERDGPPRTSDAELSALFADSEDTEPVTRAEDHSDLSAEVEAILNTARNDAEAPPLAKNVCHSASGEMLDLFATDDVPEFAVAGRLRAQDALSVYRRIPFTEEIVPDPMRASIAEDVVGRLVLLGQPFGGRARDPGDGVPVQLAQVLDTGFLTFSALPDPTGDKAIRLLVAADAATLAVSGLDRLEQQMLDWAPGRVWRVDWAEITSLGDVLDPVQYNSLSDLVAAVAGRDDAFAAVDADKFDKLMTGLTRSLASPGMPVARFLWLVEGHPLPHTAPARFEQMIQQVNAGGNVVRRSDGRARKWLEVIAGQYSTPFAQSYLEGPVLTSSAGYMSVEHRNGPTRDVILTTTNAISDRIRLDLNVAGIATDAPTPSPVVAVNPEELVFDRAGLVDEAGLLVARTAYPDLMRALTMTDLIWTQLENGTDTANADDVIDALSLVAMRTRDDGSVLTRTLSARDLERRLKLVRARPDGANDLASLRLWLLATTARGLTLTGNAACDYLFFPDTGL